MPNPGKTPRIERATKPVQLGSSSVLQALSDLKMRTEAASRKPTVISAKDIMVQITHGPTDRSSTEPVVVESPVPLGDLIRELLRHLNNDVGHLVPIIIPLLTNGKIKFEDRGQFKRLQVLPPRTIQAAGARRILDDFLEQIQNETKT
jgi:hypothetical protein